MLLLCIARTFHSAQGLDEGAGLKPIRFPFSVPNPKDGSGNLTARIRRCAQGPRVPVRNDHHWEKFEAQSLSGPVISSKLYLGYWEQ